MINVFCYDDGSGMSTKRPYWGRCRYSDIPNGTKEAGTYAEGNTVVARTTPTPSIT